MVRVFSDGSDADLPDADLPEPGGWLGPDRRSERRLADPADDPTDRHAWAVERPGHQGARSGSRSGPLASRGGRGLDGAAIAPVSLAGERVLPVVSPLAEILPAHGLRRGSVVVVPPGCGATTLALVLGVRVTGEGGWMAAVGLTDLGLGAIVGLGVDLRRFVVVRPAGPSLARVVAGVLAGVDVVALWPSSPIRADDARRLTARARREGAVLTVVGHWPDRADIRLRVGRLEWQGLESPAARLTERRMEVVVEARSRPHPARAVLLLPDRHGRPSLADTPTSREPVGPTGLVRERTSEDAFAPRGVPSRPISTVG